MTDRLEELNAVFMYLFRYKVGDKQACFEKIIFYEIESGKDNANSFGVLSMCPSIPRPYAEEDGNLRRVTHPYDGTLAHTLVPKVWVLENISCWPEHKAHGYRSKSLKYKAHGYRHNS